MMLSKLAINLKSRDVIVENSPPVRFMKVAFVFVVLCLLGVKKGYIFLFNNL